MSKLYEKYYSLKRKENIVYLFKSGIFYLFLADDAIKMNKELGLKCTHLNDEILKCGFPVSSVDKYTNILKEKNIMYKIVDKEVINDEDGYLNNKKIIKILERIKNEDLDKISGLKALQILYELRDILERN